MESKGGEKRMWQKRNSIWRKESAEKIFIFNIILFSLKWCLTFCHATKETNQGYEERLFSQTPHQVASGSVRADFLIQENIVLKLQFMCVLIEIVDDQGNSNRFLLN